MTHPGLAHRARQVGRNQPRAAAHRPLDSHLTPEPRHPARARLRHRDAARLPLQAPRRQRGAVASTSATRCAAASRCSAPSGSRSAWAIALGAWLLHVAALALAPLSVVQAVLSTGVVMLAVLAERIFGFEVGPRQWAGVAMTAGGLVLLVVTLPAAHGAHSAYSLAGMISFEAGMLAIGALLISGPHLGAPDHHHGIMLGAAAGTLFGVSDVAIKALTGLGGIADVLVSPWLAIAAIASVVAFYASARGMQDGEAVPVIAADLDRRQRLLHPRRHRRLRRPDARRHARHRAPGRRLRDGHRRRAGHAAAGARGRGERVEARSALTRAPGLR